MNRLFTKGLILLATFILFACGHAFAQTITIGNVDPGPYAPGSTITAPISVTGNCVNTTTTYDLYLSNAAGSFAAQKLIGTFSDFYATFVNGVIPVGTPAGAGYVVKVVSTNPIVTSSISAPFSITAGTGVVAAVNSQAINAAANATVFGTCSGVNNTPYSFVNTSTAGATVTASFFNEVTQASEGTITPTAAGTQFTANAANYTVAVKAVAGGIVGTESYLLINNGVNTSFGVTGNSTICLSGGGSLTYNVDISSPSGIQNNFPGLIYNIKWGDGSTSLLTLCDIIASGGKISHKYTQSSCGNNPNGQSNSFEVDLQPSSKYCGKVGTQVTSYAQIVTAPKNSFIRPIAACVNTQVTFANTSDPGQNPNNTSPTCQATNALYTWIVDGVTMASNYGLVQSFKNTFTTSGVHNITLHLQNPSALCSAPDVTESICIQNPPQPKFTLPTLKGCAPATIIPANQSIIDANCNATNKYVWTVAGGNVTYANGTDANSAQPQFVFTTAGTYTLTLGITTVSCGTITTPAQTVVIDSPIAISMSPDDILCGTNQSFTFGPTVGPTQTTISGVGQQQANSYTWTVTGGAYSFASGSTANSQYPQITFTAFAAYKVSVTVQNNCGSLTKSQNLTFQDAPTVKITPSAPTICPGSPVTLKAAITGTYTTFQWIGSGAFSAPGSLTTNYTPTAAEITAGSATVTLDVKTALSGQCADIQQSITINIYSVNTITSASTSQICTGNPVGYNITSSVPASTFSWTAALTSGTATGLSAGNGPAINNTLINNGTGDAVVSYTITPVANGCQGVPFVLMVTVKPLPKAIVTPLNSTICTGSSTSLNLTSNVTGTTYTYTSVVLTGNITGNTQQPIASSATTISDFLTNNGAIPGTVKYTITPFNGSCPGMAATAVVTIEPMPVISNPGANNEVCNVTQYKLNGNSPGPGTGKWTVSPAGPVFNNPTLPNAIASLLIPGSTYTFTWTITPPLPCAPNSNSMTLIDDLPSIGGTTSGNTSVCSGSSAGTITLSGQVGNVTGWQSSTDSGVTWQAVLPTNTTASLQYLNITATTQYRAIVQSGVCSVQPSTVTTIIVNQPAIQAIAGSDQNLCGATTTMLQGNNPSPFQGIWSQTAGPVATIVSPNSAQTQVNGLQEGNVYTFSWTIKGVPPCGDNSASVNINNANDVTASFTADKTDGCGDYTVNFNNTSTVLTGTGFLWDFGDGTAQSTATSLSHLFSARVDGKDTTYVVSLYVVNNCFQRPPFTLKITVRPQTPIAYISPKQLIGCSPFTLAVDNLSPGNNQSYTYYLYNGATLVQQVTKTDKSEVQFNPITTNSTIQYTLYMVATGFCGNTGQSNIIPITISVTNVVAQMFIENGVSKGCAPFSATFVNNSFGADNYYYTIYDVNHNVVDRRQGGTTPLPYTFSTPGTFYVTVTAANSCSTVESNPPIRVDVYPIPSPAFTTDVTTGCRELTVTFTNQTPGDPNIQATSLLYDWDFGDGSAHALGYTPPPHVYSFKNSPFTVTLTATNPVTNCSNAISQAGYINVAAPPATQFIEKPDSVTSVPNYHFDFIDQTTGNPVSWAWTLGDGSTSASQNPGHTYLDTGFYKVTLTTASATGCDSTITHIVRVTGIPGQLFLPNAFEPAGGTLELRTFMAKGSGIKQWHMQVFNNYSQLVWETTKLDDKGAPVDGWDGTFNGQPAPQGVYIWQISATFINGTEWKGNVLKNSLPKRVGVVQLIR